MLRHRLVDPLAVQDLRDRINRASQANGDDTGRDKVGYFHASISTTDPKKINFKEQFEKFHRLG